MVIVYIIVGWVAKPEQQKVFCFTSCILSVKRLELKFKADSLSPLKPTGKLT